MLSRVAVAVTLRACTTQMSKSCRLSSLSWRQGWSFPVWFSCRVLFTYMNLSMCTSNFTIICIGLSQYIYMLWKWDLTDDKWEERDRSAFSHHFSCGKFNPEFTVDFIVNGSCSCLEVFSCYKNINKRLNIAVKALWWRKILGVMDQCWIDKEAQKLFFFFWFNIHSPYWGHKPTNQLTLSSHWWVSSHCPCF